MQQAKLDPEPAQDTHTEQKVHLEKHTHTHIITHKHIDVHDHRTPKMSTFLEVVWQGLFENKIGRAHV